MVADELDDKKAQVEKNIENLETDMEFLDADIQETDISYFGDDKTMHLTELSDLEAEAVMAFVADRVAPYKKVRRVEFIDVIPKSASGKILRRELRARETVAG